MRSAAAFKQAVAPQALLPSRPPGLHWKDGMPLPKLLLRPRDAEDRSRSNEECTEPPKTLKQKEAEYAAARARIFGTKAPSGQGGGGGGRRGGGRGGGGNKRVGGRGGGCGYRNSGGQGYRGCGGNSGARLCSGLRSRVDDFNDPDYDRRTGRYAPRLAWAPDDNDFASTQWEDPLPRHGSAQRPALMGLRRTVVCPDRHLERQASASACAQDGGDVAPSAQWEDPLPRLGFVPRAAQVRVRNASVSGQWKPSLDAHRQLLKR